MSNSWCPSEKGNKMEATRWLTTMSNTERTDRWAIWRSWSAELKLAKNILLLLITRVCERREKESNQPPTEHLLTRVAPNANMCWTRTARARCLDCPNGSPRPDVRSCNMCLITAISRTANLEASRKKKPRYEGQAGWHLDPRERPEKS